MTGEYAKKHGMWHVEIGKEQVCRDAQFIDYNRYVNGNKDLKAVIDRSIFPNGKVAQLLSDLIRFHFAAFYGNKMLYVDRDAMPPDGELKGPMYARLGTAIDHCVFYDDNPYRMRWMWNSILKKLPVESGMYSIGWAVMHALVNELMIEEAKAVDVFHLSKTNGHILR